MSGNKLGSLTAIHISHFDSEIDNNLETMDLIEEIQNEGVVFLGMSPVET